MKRIVLIGVATAAALSTAAFAQTNATPAPNPATPAKTTTQENVKAPSLRQEVRDSLQKAGLRTFQSRPIRSWCRPKTRRVAM